MRSYTNRKGETITVSKEHLDTAVELKILLQKSSPSQRCSWVEHKRMMQKEGFHDSENSEPYRQMIKSYQKSIGELPTAETHADLVVSSKLESYRELVGDLSWEKRENQNYLRRINKGKRDIIDNGVFIEEVKLEIRNVLREFDLSEIASQLLPSPSMSLRTGTRIILCLTDWHIGAIVETEGNRYNYSIAKRRIHNAVDQAMKIAVERGATRIDVVYMGDILEHAYMRDSQAYDAEFPVSRQMALAGRLMIEVLYKLSRNKDFQITYRGFAGNHDRLNKDKNGNIDGDTGMVVVNEMVELFLEESKIENIRYVECQDYSAKLINVNGRNFKFVHGDLLKKNDTGKLADNSSNDNIIYDALVYGHFHHYMVLEVGVDRFEIRVGSTKGSDNYSEKLGLGSSPSQALIAVDINGDIDVQKLSLIEQNYCKTRMD